MKEHVKRRLQTYIIISFYVIVIALLVNSRIQAYSLAPSYKPLELRNHPIWFIPLVYLYDYFSHAWLCLLFAFSIAGLIYELVPKESITRYIGSSRGYRIRYGAWDSPLPNSMLMHDGSAVRRSPI
ncbi:MAG: hypothetical protein QW502_04110 [Candidatus Bathyarchaeia archaeon]